MAVRTWLGGRQIARANVYTLTITAADTAATITITCGGTQSVPVTPTTNNTTTTATDIYNALQGVGGCFTDLTVSNAVSVVTFIGPADGAPVTLSKVDAGGNATTLTQTVAPLSPYDLADAVNWASSNFPTGGDQAVFENSSVPAKYNLDALSGITLAAGSGASSGLIRRRSFTGSLSLPDANTAGYAEYRPTKMSFKCSGLYWEASKSDTAQQFRLTSTFSGAAVTVIVQGDSTSARVGSEALEIDGLPTGQSNTGAITNASVAFAPLQSQACTLSDINAIDSTIRIGPSAVLSATLTFEDCLVQIASSWTTSLTADGSTTQIEVTGAAGGPIALQGGYTTWHSTGSPSANPVIGGGATLDLDTAPAVLAIGGVVDMNAGGGLLDKNGRGGLYALKGRNCSPSEFIWTQPANRSFTTS